VCARAEAAQRGQAAGSAARDSDAAENGSAVRSAVRCMLAELERVFSVCMEASGLLAPDPCRTYPRRSILTVIRTHAAFAVCSVTRCWQALACVLPAVLRTAAVSATSKLFGGCRSCAPSVLSKRNEAVCDV